MEKIQGDGLSALLADTRAHVFQKTDALAALPKRVRDSHKGSYGSAAIVAGSIEYTGAAYLSAAACLRAGAGYTTLFLPSGILPYYFLRAPELLLKSINEGDRYAFKCENMDGLLGYSSVAFGMGMGASEAVAKGAAYLLRKYTGKLILDADGLNSLALYEKENLTCLFRNAKCDVVLTPHLKEFSRLCGYPIEEIVKDRIGFAKAFAKQNKITLLLKGAVSVLTDGERVVLNATGNSALAKGGSGDVLSGVTAGLCAMGASAFEGAAVAAYITGSAAELASARLSEYSVTATDVISYLGAAFLDVTENSNE